MCPCRSPRLPWTLQTTSPTSGDGLRRHQRRPARGPRKTRDFVQYLLAHAAQLGVTVHVAHLPHPYRGYYDAVAKIIVYDFNLAPIERVCVLAHELGQLYHEQDRTSTRLNSSH